ncbi:MAG: nucleotidyltransferase family protein [Marmoricola sp.]
MHPTPAAVRRVRTWSRGALRLEAGRSWTPEAATEDPADLLEAIRRHRVAELVHAHAEALAVPAAVAGPLAELRAANRRALTVQVLEIGRLHRLFTEAGIDCLVIKGPALAVQTAGNPAARGSGDVDLLVAPDRVEDAYRLLSSSGWLMRPGSEVEPGTWAWRHVLSSFNAFTFDGPGSTVDLHWRLDPTYDALPTFELAWSRRETVDLGGLEVPTLGACDVLAHASMHAAKDSWRWVRSLVDVHRLAGSPQTWERSFDRDPLRRLEVSTLAVTRFVVGLPDGVPAEVLARLDQVPASVLARAVAAQERPVYATYPFPGIESMRLLRYMITASPTLRDLKHSAVSTAVPAKAVVGVEASSAWTGVPLSLWFRVRRLRGRSVAWVRREPGAGVVEPLVRTPR